MRTLKFMGLFLAALALTSTAYAKTVLISDIDDTLKQSNIRSLQKMTFLRSEEFAGLSRLYTDLRLESVDDIAYVTSAPKVLISKLSETFLEEHSYPDGAFYDRSLTDTTEEHKLESIQTVLNRSRADLVVLIGDNGEKDPAIYARVVNSNPRFNHLVYMHQIHDEEIPAGQIPWLTAVDLATHLYSVELLSSASFEATLKSVVERLISRRRELRESVFPDWGECRLFFKRYKRPAVELTRTQSQLLASYEKWLAKRCGS